MEGHKNGGQELVSVPEPPLHSQKKKTEGKFFFASAGEGLGPRLGKSIKTGETQNKNLVIAYMFWPSTIMML